MITFLTTQFNNSIFFHFIYNLIIFLRLLNEDIFIRLSGGWLMNSNEESVSPERGFSLKNLVSVVILLGKAKMTVNRIPVGLQWTSRGSDSSILVSLDEQELEQDAKKLLPAEKTETHKDTRL